jgi:putative toxin-antitoxin system antitoxin component (TIGR02293 family)
VGKQCAITRRFERARLQRLRRNPFQSGIPRRTLTRRLAQHSRLTAAESDRAVRLAQVFSNAIDTLGDEEKAAAWLKTPNRALRGGRPLDQLDTDPGVREVETVLGRISYGIYS